MLPSKILVIPSSPANDPEDILATSLPILFTDEVRDQHGDPGCTIIYSSSRFGDLKLSIADPSREDDRLLFAHYLWNAGVSMAERVAGEGLAGEEKKTWAAEGEKVLELGAGAGLAGVVSALTEAQRVVISDYPRPKLLQNIMNNLERNVPEHIMQHVQVVGHEWGVLDDDFSKVNKGHFTRILAADCLWMQWQHRNLARSVLYFLAPDAGSRALVIAGFHTGRAKLSPFFDVVVEEGLEVEDIYEQDVDGSRRPWAKERDGGRENVTERKRWLVFCVLKRRTRTIGS